MVLRVQCAGNSQQCGEWRLLWDTNFKSDMYVRMLLPLTFVHFSLCLLHVVDVGQVGIIPGLQHQGRGDEAGGRALLLEVVPAEGGWGTYTWTSVPA